MFEHFIAGFIINFATSIDDAITDIPVLSSATHSRKGRFAYALGKILAVLLAIGIAFVLSKFISTLPNSNILVAILIFIMAFVIHFNLLSLSTPKKVSKKVEQSVMTRERFIKLVVLGFFMTFTTMLDDMFTLAPLFLGSWDESLVAISGILTATLVIIALVLFFTRQLTAIPHKREISTVVLVGFGFLLLFGVV